MYQRPPEELDLNNDDVLYPGEEPVEIVGFSKYARKDKSFCYKTSRHDIFQHKPIKDQVIDVIKHHTPTLSRSGKSKFTPFIDGDALDDALVAERDKRLNLDQKNAADPPPHPSEIQTCVNGTLQCGSHVFKLSRPTLFIFTTDLPQVKFRDKCIIPKWPSGSLFPWCNNIRLWEKKTVMGWYSGYQSGKDEAIDKALKPLIFWFDLAIRGPKTKFDDGLMDPGLDPP